MKSNDILSLIQNSIINPYEILGIISDNNISPEIIKKAYKKKALILHPDKTNGKTENEFKVLYICYKYLNVLLEKENKQKLRQDYYFNILKNKGTIENTSKRDSNEYLKKLSTSNKVNINSNWNNAKFRQQYLIDDDLPDEEEYLSNQKNKKKYNSYQEAISDTKIDNFLFKKNEKFDIKKFNALFELLKQQQESTQLVKYDSKNIQPLNNEDISLGSIRYVKDIIAVNDNSNSKKNYYSEKCYDYKEVDDINNSTNLSKLAKSLTKKKIKEIENNKAKNTNTKLNTKNYYNKFNEDMKHAHIETMDEFLHKKAQEYVNYEVQTNQFIERNISKLPIEFHQDLTRLIGSSDMLNEIKYLEYNNSKSKKNKKR